MEKRQKAFINKLSHPDFCQFAYFMHSIIFPCCAHHIISFSCSRPQLHNILMDQTYFTPCITLHYIAFVYKAIALKQSSGKRQCKRPILLPNIISGKIYCHWKQCIADNGLGETTSVYPNAKGAGYVTGNENMLFDLQLLPDFKDNGQVHK